MTRRSDEHSRRPEFCIGCTALAPRLWPAESGPEKKANYLVRHWRGELSLGVSYWVNRFLANVAALFVVSAITKSPSDLQSNYSCLRRGWITQVHHESC